MDLVDHETGQVVSAVVQTGRVAWQRIRISGKKLREDWLMLAAGCGGRGKTGRFRA
jgi:hypothetical protein